jgi:hypothetical protein
MNLERKQSQSLALRTLVGAEGGIALASPGADPNRRSAWRRAGAVWCVIPPKPPVTVLRCCSGEWVAAVHDLQVRQVRDLPIFEAPVELVVPRVRLLCPGCGPKLEHLSWLEPYTRVTVRLTAGRNRFDQRSAHRPIARSEQEKSPDQLTLIGADVNEARISPNSFLASCTGTPSCVVSRGALPSPP